MCKTSEYIKMSIEAKKIQELLKDKFDWSRQGYCIQHKNFIKVNEFGSSECPGWAEIYETDAILASQSENCFEFNRWIGLPYQGQLQKIYFDFCQNKVDWQYPKIRWMAASLEQILYFNDCWRREHYGFESYEQVWLAFVMKEKYNKIWDDKNEKWIKT